MLNKAILVGRLAADPELRYTSGQIPVISFSVAVNRPYNKNAEQRQADFIDCVAWRNTAEFISKYFHKGSVIVVDGRIQVSNYTTNNNEKRRRVEVLVENVNFGYGSNSGGGQGGNAVGKPEGENGQAPGEAVSYSSGSNADFVAIDDDDDLPF